MRRRLTVAMVSMVAAALLLAGFVGLLATVRHARDQARRELVGQAQGLARVVHTEAAFNNRRDPALALRNILRSLKAPLRLQGEVVLAITQAGRVINPANPGQAVVLPSGLALPTIKPQALFAGSTVSGSYPRGVFAAVPYATPIQINNEAETVELVVVVTRSPPTGLAAGGPWFLLSSAVIVVVSLIVANRLGHRFVRPLEAAQEVTGRIAGGDLTARVPEGRSTDPELEALARSINAMADALARSQGAEREFLLSVSHELRTPLTSIRGFAEAIEDGAAPDAGQAAGVIAGESRRLERLVGDLLDLARLSTRSFSLYLVDVHLADLVATSAAGFGPEAARLGVALHVDRPPVDMVVRTDPDRLAQVVANLTENALAFASTQVHVGFGPAAPDNAGETAGPGFVCWVDDDGPGIAPEDLERVFERLFTDRTHGARKLGTGLGLSIVAELVSALGGTVRAESPLLSGGGGTRIVVVLPGR